MTWLSSRLIDHFLTLKMKKRKNLRGYWWKSNKYFKECFPFTKFNVKEVENLIEITYIKTLEARCVHNFSYLPILEFLLKKENTIKRVKTTILYKTTNACLKQERQTHL